MVVNTVELGKKAEPQESLQELKVQIDQLRLLKETLEQELRRMNNELTELHLKYIRKQLSSVPVEKVYTPSEEKKIARIAKNLGVSVEAFKKAMEESNE